MIGARLSSGPALHLGSSGGGGGGGRTSPSSTSSTGKMAALAAAAAAVAGGAVYLFLASRGKGPRDAGADSAPRPPPLSTETVAAAKPVGGDDEDDMFSSPTGLRLFSAEYSAEKGQRSRGGFGAGAPPSSLPAKGAAASSGGVGAAEVFSEDILRRRTAMNMLRALLSRVEGLEYDDSSSSSSGDSDVTDVSLNFRIASELELSARDELMDVFADYRMAQEEGEERRLYDALTGEAGTAAAAGGDEAAELELLGPVLAKMIEYLDISNEREQLRIRRDQKRAAEGRSGPARVGPHSQFVMDHDDDDDDDEAAWEDDDDDDDGGDDIRAGRGGGGGPDSAGVDLIRRLVSGAGGAGAGRELDEALHRARAAAAEAAEDAEVFEDEWGDMDEEEAAFMEYLEQDDGAAHHLSRGEVLRRRRERRDPDSIQIIGEGGRRFEDVLNGDFNGILDDDDNVMEAMYHRFMAGTGDDDDDEDDYEDYEGEEEEEGFGLAGDSEPWTDMEKAEFEANLLEQVREMAEQWGVTAAMGERAVAAEEREREQRRQARREAKDAAAASLAHRGKRNNGGGDDNDDDGDEEWEDVEEEEEGEGEGGDNNVTVLF